LKGSVASVGNIDHTKDDYDISKETIFPAFDRMIKELQESYVCSDNLTRFIITRDSNIAESSAKSVRVRVYVCSDYKFIAEVQGKPNRAGFWCPFCDIDMNAIKSDATNRGTLWTINRWKQKLDLQSNKPNINRGVVKESLLSTIPPSDYLIAILHQLLGTGNDIRKEILDVSDKMFENWTEELVAKHDEVVATMIDRDAKRQVRAQNEQTIKHLEETLRNLEQNYDEFFLNQGMQDAFIQQINSVKTHITTLKNNRAHLNSSAG